MKTLHTIYSTFAKHNMAKFLTVLTILLIVGVGQAWGADETLSCPKGTISNNTMTFSTTNFTFVHAKGSGSNFAAYTPWRVYAKNTVTITAGSGVASIDKIEIVHSSTYYSTIESSSGIVTMASTSGGTTIINSTSGKTVTLTVTGSSQSRWSSIKITYTAASSCDKKVTVNKGTPSNGSFSISKTGTYETCDAPLVITLSNITPSAGYQFGAITQTGIGTGVTIDQANKTVTYAKNTSGTSTINVTFEQKQSAEITLSEADATQSITGKYVGDSYKLPSSTDAKCGDKTFVGWSTVTIDNSVNKPTSNFYEPGASVTLAATNKFYAVFAEGGGEEVVTSISGGDWSNGVSGGNWTTSGTGTYSGNGVKFDGANDYVLSPDISSKNYSELLLKFKSGYNGNKGSVLTFYAYNKDKILLTDDDVTISPETVVPDVPYTSQNTIYEVSISANEVIGQIMIKMTSKTSNLGMKYCEIFGVSSSFQNYTTQCTTETVPSLSASVNTLAFNEVTVNSPKELEFTLSGSNLTADATLALSGTSESMFRVNPNSVTPTDGSITDQIITVTYTPTTKDSHAATLTISSTDAKNVTISLSGTGVAQMAYYTVNHYQQNLDGTYPLTPTNTQKLSGEVETQVTPAVKSYPGFTAPSTKTVTINSDGSTVVDYQYTRNKYTLTWDVNEGNALTGSYTSGSVKYGAAITKPADPTRDGHSFKGWHNGTSIVTPETTMPASNLIYTAQWVKTHTITFYNNGIVYGTAQIVEDGNSVTLPTTPTSCDTEKYPHFYGWTETPINGVTATKPADLITASFTPTDNMELHAVFVDQLPQEGGWIVVENVSELVAGNIYTIGSYGSPDSGTAMGTQNSNNRATASWTNGTPVELTLGGTTDAWTLYDAAYSGGTYTGGYLYAASSSSNHLKTRQDITNDAKWKITISSKKAKIVAQGNNERNIIRYNSDNSIFSCYASGQGDIQLLKRAISSEPSAFITSCCETEAPTNGTYTNVTGSGSSMSVQLNWEDDANAGRYHITGENLGDNEYAYATNYTVSGLTECETYTFYVSAYPEGGCESPKLAIEVTPYIPKTVTFKDGSTTTQKTTSCDSKTVTVPNASKECYTSIWTDKNGNKYSNGQTITPTEDMTLTAQYTIIEYEITFVDEDGTELQKSDVNCGEKPTYTGETPTKEADAVYQYTFADWSPAIVPANDHATYTATYNKTKQIYTVEWYVNGKIANPEQVEAEDYATAPDIVEVPCGAVIAGWTDAEGGKYEHDSSTLHQGAKPSIQILSNKKFYAVFADIDE